MITRAQGLQQRLDYAVDIPFAVAVNRAPAAGTAAPAASSGPSTPPPATGAAYEPLP